jgi:uncharacterized membrane protein YhaH (DUF805 family)
VGLIRFLFSLEGRVTRLQFLTAGAALTALKFAVEASWALFVRDVILSPLRYFHPVMSIRYDGALRDDWALLLLWSLPFLWIGFALTVRRVDDAGWPHHLPVFFFIPGLNLVLFSLLCAIPSSNRRVVDAADGADTTPSPDRTSLRDAAVAAFVAFLIALPMAITPLVTEYGVALFVGTPFVTGLLAGYIWNRREIRTPTSSMGVALTALLMTAGVLLVFAVEGVICLVMAAPFGSVRAAMGSVAGRAMARSRLPGSRAMGVLALPLPLMLAVGDLPRSGSFRDVESVIEVDAPPERVFPFVVRFPSIGAAPELLFRAGIAQPMAATIDGSGIGAVRQCHFTTGAFVEPITIWDPPHRLAFGVARQPRAMSEMTPYEAIWAPHLDGETLRVSEGEFRLVALPGSRTRIVGRTRYALDMKPDWYWALWGDEIIHRIHMRVLTHIKALSEAPVISPEPPGR